ncbi:MAG TPA: hypothetical protein VHS55_06980 [Solirubrobacteraceae bacterium]|jgi:hypothetical protein|nr:hypothetical protein [Solirubrobacteraceae bacterium]
MRRGPKIATVSELLDHTSEDRVSGAMRSVQAAEITMPEAVLQQLWTAAHLERLARTYWRFLTRVTLGLVRVRYSESERSVVLLARPLKLLSFDAPEYELDADHGVVRWRIKRGLLVARSGRGGHGHLRIEVRRLPATGAGEGSAGRGVGTAGARESGKPEVRIRIEVEVANFHPAIASGFGRRVYNATQARIHLFVTNGFLRSLARLDLAESKVGALTPPDQA